MKNLSKTEKYEFCMEQVKSWTKTMTHDELVNYFIDNQVEMLMKLDEDSFIDVFREDS